MTSEIVEIEEIKKLLLQESHEFSIFERSRKLGIGRNVAAKYMSMLHAAGQAEVRRGAAAKLYTLARQGARGDRRSLRILRLGRGCVHHRADDLRRRRTDPLPRLQDAMVAGELKGDGLP